MCDILRTVFASLTHWAQYRWLPPSRAAQVCYLDTEGSFRPERLQSIARSRGLDAAAAQKALVPPRFAGGLPGRWVLGSVIELTMT